MKFVEKVELIVKLKERIAQAQNSDEALANELQKLLDTIAGTSVNSPVI